MRPQEAFVIAAAMMCTMATTVYADVSQPRVGQHAPSMSLKSLDGKSVALTDYKGKLVVLHFGAGW